MTRFNKATIFCVIGVSFLLVCVLEFKLRQSSNTSDRRHHLCIHSKGRLGNQMFIFASAYGIARTENRKLVTTTNTLSNYFEGVTSYKGPRSCYFQAPIKEKWACAFDPELTSALPGDSDVLLTGYLQSWMYFRNYSSDIRRIFTFKRNILKKAETILEKTKRSYLARSSVNGNNLTLIGVHVRRGDMLQLGKYGYRTATLEYFLRAMDYFTRKFPDVLFVVCSDDIAWCKQNLQRKKNIRVVFSGLPAVDMAILSLCNHTISSTGSFSWWSAWLAGGQTTFFAHPAFEDSFLRKEFSETLSDYFWPGWIPLS